MVSTFFDKMNELLIEHTPFVCVTIVDAQGSVPQEIGAKMLVTNSGLYHGTVGGGKVETRAIKEAIAMLASETAAHSSTKPADNGDAPAPPRNRTRFAVWSLDRDIGMTCGGSVKVFFESYNTNTWHITVFGAGHCANALVSLLEKLDCRILCIDPRQEWLDKIPDSPKLVKKQVAEMPSYVAQIPDDSFVVLMSMGHSTDKPILLEILRNWHARQFPYLGVIGSRAKAARLYRDLEEAGLPKSYKDLFYCPVGLELGSNEPQEIAISVAAQLLQIRDGAALAKGSGELAASLDKN